MFESCFCKKEAKWKRKIEFAAVREFKKMIPASYVFDTFFYGLYWNPLGIYKHLSGT